jgi:hypothetical protein
LPIGQTAERLRVNDPTLGEDAADLTQPIFGTAKRTSRTRAILTTGGWVREDLHPRPGGTHA